MDHTGPFFHLHDLGYPTKRTIYLPMDLLELKTMSNVAKQTSDGLSKSLSTTIKDARGQSGNIIIDARAQLGMTPEIAERGIIRALGRDTETGAKIQGVTVITPQGTVYIPRKPS